MKLEGLFHDCTSLFGFAMHLGNNPYVVPVTLNRSLPHNGTADTLRLNMNINEWFENPYIYDFNVDPNYSMGIDTAMMKLSRNGKDVFGN
jgi:hypothetical protein